jgi:uncharacterized membrane protein HdeD (DUF308 family)
MMDVDKDLAGILRRRWWVLLLRGLIAIAFGVAIWVQPAISIAVLVSLFGAYALVDGILGIWIAIAGRKEHEHVWVLLLWGLIGIFIGVITFLVPHVTALALLFYIAAWAMATGALEIVAAIRLRKEIAGEWLLVLGGLASMVVGMWLLARPLEGALAVLWLIGTFAAMLGVLLVVLAIKARSFGKKLEHS